VNAGRIVPPQGFRTLCTSDDIQWYDAVATVGGHSNFRFVDESYESRHTVRRIFSLARKLGFRSFCVETVLPDTDWLQEEDANLRSRNCGFKESKVERISFFETDVARAKRGLISPKEYIGYVVVKRDVCKSVDRSRLYVYESVLPTYRDEKLTFLHCCQQYQVQYRFGTFGVTGALYAQQNGLTFVCAHVALRSVLSLVLENGDISYAEINRLAGISVSDGDIGMGKGMSSLQLEKVLREKGVIFRKIGYDPKNKDLRQDYSQYLYGFTESNCPSILTFNTKKSAHAIPVVGHTFDEDMWPPDADGYFIEKKKHYSSERWVGSFLIHDDNYGPYLCLPKKYLDDTPVIIYGLSVERDALGFDTAEFVASEWLNSFANTVKLLPNADWYNRFVVYAKHKMLVLRPVLVDKSAYLHHLPKSSNKTALERLNNLPETFWVVEASFPELFSGTRAKVGDAVLSCHLHEDFSGKVTPILLRLPGLIYFNGDSEITAFGDDYHSPLLRNH